MPPLPAGDVGGHVPVLVDEVVRILARPGAVLIDATVGNGGHAVPLLEASGSGARLLGLDLDESALERARERLEKFGSRVRLARASFARLEEIARAAGSAPADGILFDLGLRTEQLESARGFSFRDPDAPLDMRFDPTGEAALPEPVFPALQRIARQREAFTAADVLARLSAEELEDLFHRYGDERAARRIARAIAAQRGRRPVRTVGDLSTLVVKSLPPRARHGRLHAATRVFQALRIAVNRELESLEIGLRAACALLRPGGRVSVLSYHSGEDRIAKRMFREAERGAAYAQLTRRPKSPSEDEMRRNPRSRSAKIRTLERLPIPT